MPLTVHYTTERWDTWRWLRARWRPTAWRVSLPFGFLIFVALVNRPFSLRFLLVTISLPFVVCAGVCAAMSPFILISLRLFKPQHTLVSLEEAGLCRQKAQTTGPIPAIWPWTRIRAISQSGDDIIFQIKSHYDEGWIVPARAFGSEQERQQFLAFAQTARRRSNIRP